MVKPAIPNEKNENGLFQIFQFDMKSNLDCESGGTSFQAISYENIIMAFIVLPSGAIFAGIILTLELLKQRNERGKNFAALKKVADYEASILQ